MKRSHRVYDAVKRVADIMAAALLLVIAAPVLAAVAILVRVKLGAPVLFRQDRPGKDGRIFTLYKFRTMVPSASEGAEAVASDAARLTPFGRVLRASSLDELPELYNVLKGDMSLVGPRPLLVEYLGRYTPEQARRHEVRPGLTGWAQVNGRNALDWETRFQMDVWYVDHRSLRLDAVILWRTLATVVSRTGVTAEGRATMEPFDPKRTAPREEDL